MLSDVNRGVVSRPLKTATRIVEPSRDETAALKQGGYDLVGESGRGWKDGHYMPLGPYIAPAFTGERDWGLSPHMLREVYRNSSVVRPAIDFITRTLSTTPWRIVAAPGVPKRDFKYAVELMSRPSPAGARSFREFLSKWLNDQLILDTGIIEKVRSPGGNLLEVIPRDAGTFKVEGDDNGMISGFTQQVSGKDPIPFSSEDIVYSMMYPRTESLYGTPVIEGCIREITALIQATNAISSFFSDDEIPMGILYLGEIGRQSAERLEQKMSQNKGYKAKRALHVFSGRGTPDWIQFQRPWREMEIAQIMPRLERIVWRSFGVTPMDQGAAADVNRSTAEQFKEIRVFTLVKPLLDMLAERITFDILHEIHEGLYIEFHHYARTGDERDGEDEGTNVDDYATGNTQHPALVKKAKKGKKPEREQEQASPLFNNEYARGTLMCISRPPIMPTDSVLQRERDKSVQRLSTQQIVEGYLDGETMQALEDAKRGVNAAIDVLLEETLNECAAAQERGASEAQIRTIASNAKSEILHQAHAGFHAVEGHSQRFVAQVDSNCSVPSRADDMLKKLSRQIDEIVVKQLASTTLPSVEEATMIRFFDRDKISPDSMLDDLASTPVKLFLDTGSK